MDYSASLVAVGAALALFWVLRRPSALPNIPGPPSPSWIFGNMLKLLLAARYGDNEFTWIKLYGPVYHFKGCFGQDRLMISDSVALQHILNSPHFVHSSHVDNLIHLLYGKRSVSGMKGESHRRLRASLNAGFTVAAVRNCQPIFEKLAQALTEQLEQSSASSIDVSPLLSMATLGAISEAVLGYSTQDLGEEFVANNCQVVALASSQAPLQILGEAIMAGLPAWVISAVTFLPTPAFKILRKAKYLANHFGCQAV